MESLEVLEDSQNKENMNDSCGFILLQNSWLSFFFSRNKQEILNS